MTPCAAGAVAISEARTRTLLFPRWSGSSPGERNKRNEVVEQSGIEPPATFGFLDPRREPACPEMRTHPPEGAFVYSEMAPIDLSSRWGVDT
jgi:hypothetical protein